MMSRERSFQSLGMIDGAERPAANHAAADRVGLRRLDGCRAGWLERCGARGLRGWRGLES